MISFEKRQRAQGAAACVGVDAGKFAHALVVRPRGGQDSRAIEFSTDRGAFDEVERLVRQMLPNAAPADILVGIEFAGCYGFTFAHYLHALGYPVVSVLPAHTKHWKHVAHNQALKTDAKDAASITDLVSQGHFVGFPFMVPEYAALRYLVTSRERLSKLRRATLTQIRTHLQLVFPEFEGMFPRMQNKRTPMAILRAYPGPEALLAAPKRKLLKLIQVESRGHLGQNTYEDLIEGAQTTLGLPIARAHLKSELPLLLARLALFEAQMAEVEAELEHAVHEVPEGPYLLTIPRMGPLTAGIFLGSIGSPQAYHGAQQVLKVAGLSLVERSSGILRGHKHISKQGRPLLRQAAYMFAVRSITKTGIFRTEYEGLLARNGDKSRKALVAIMRSALRVWYRVARDQRPYTLEPPPRPPRLQVQV